MSRMARVRRKPPMLDEKIGPFGWLGEVEEELLMCWWVLIIFDVMHFWC